MEKFIVLLLLAQKRQLEKGLNFDNSTIIQDLNEIKLELVQIKAQLSGQSSMQINPLQIIPSYAHTENWNIQLSGLTNITDGDDSTATNYGEIHAANNSVGLFTIDLGNLVTAPFSIVEFLISIQNTNGNNAYWGLEIEQQGNWINIWGEHRVAPSSSDTQILRTLVVKGQWQRLRFILKDTGTWAPRIKIYALRVFTVS